MSKVEKLIEKLKSKPKDFTWDEKLKVLNYFGFEQMAQGKTGGSRRKFVNNEKQIISFARSASTKSIEILSVGYHY